MRELARHLKIKAGSLYYHIASKEDLLSRVCRIGMTELMANVDQAIRRHDTLPERLDAIVSGHAKVIEDYGNYLRSYENEHVHLPPQIQEEMRQELVRFHHRIDDIFDEAASAQQMRANINVKTARFAMIATLLQLSRLQIDQHQSDLSGIADGFSDILINGLVRR
jgi:AcrR family transcriptional regulator